MVEKYGLDAHMAMELFSRRRWPAVLAQVLECCVFNTPKSALHFSNKCFFKYVRAKRLPLFCLFSFFPQRKDKYSTNRCVWDSNLGSRMMGADESTELRRDPFQYVFYYWSESVVHLLLLKSSTLINLSWVLPTTAAFICGAFGCV